MNKKFFLLYLISFLTVIFLFSCKTSLKLGKKDIAGSSKNSTTTTSSSDENDTDDDDQNSDSDSQTCFSLNSGSVDEDICNLEALIIQKTNEYRVKQKKSELIPNKALSCAARDAATKNHSASTAHSGFPYNRTTVVKKCDSKYESDSGSVKFLSAENWAPYSASKDLESVASGIVNMWIKSSGHKTNMLGNHTYIGVGVSKSGSSYYSIQLFGQ